MVEGSEIFIEKAEQSLAGAQSELVNQRYDNCANRCYYACFQAAIYALMQAEVRPPGGANQWGHDFVQATFIGQLINRRKVYPAELRDVLERTYALRQRADYLAEHVSNVQASRAVRRTRDFVGAIRGVWGETR